MDLFWTRVRLPPSPPSIYHVDYNVEYFQFEIGDIVRERHWITVEPGRPMYGIVAAVERNGYADLEWIDTGDDRLTILWFRHRQTENLPSCFIELVSMVNKLFLEDRE